MINRNHTGPCEKLPNLRCLRVLRTRKHLKFGNFLLVAEQLRLTGLFQVLQVALD